MNVDFDFDFVGDPFQYCHSHKLPSMPILPIALVTPKVPAFNHQRIIALVQLQESNGKAVMEYGNSCYHRILIYNRNHKRSTYNQKFCF